MFRVLKKNFKKAYSVFHIALLFLQSVAPTAFLVAPAYANTEVVEAEVSNVTLSFISETNTFVLSGNTTNSAEYMLSYSDGITEKEEGVLGVVSGDFSEEIYAGTCSNAQCVPHPVTAGSLKFATAGYAATFQVIDNNTWLIEGEKATLATVSKNTTYAAPQDSEVTVTFTKLPENPGSLSIEKVSLTNAQMEVVGATTAIAYDITSSMENGTFEYELTLPKPKDATDELAIIYADSVADLSSAETIESNVIATEDTITAKGLNHFTIFIVTTNPVADCAGGVYLSGSCYADLQTAVTDAVSGDTIELTSDITLTQLVAINKPIIIDGKGHTIFASFSKTSNSNNAALGIYSNDVIIKDLVLNGVGGASWPLQLHGLNIYKATNVLLDGISVTNFGGSGIVVNGSAVTATDVVTSGNSWHGINVDQGSGVIEPAVLTIMGTSSHSDLAHIYTDDSTKNITLHDVENQYSISNPQINGKTNDKLYTLKDLAPPATPSGLRRLGADGNIYQCGDVSVRQNMVPMWNANTEPDFSHYEYSSFHPNGTQGLNEQVLAVPQLDNTWVAPNDGTYGFAVRAVDTSNNKSEWALTSESLAGSCQITYDSTAPAQPTIIKPSAEQYFTTTPIINEWTAVSDTGSGVDRYQIGYLYDDLHAFGGSTCAGEQIDGQTLSGCRDVTGLTRNHVPALSEQGGVTIWVRAIDGVGNVGEWSESVHYYYDVTAPTQPTWGTIYKGNGTNSANEIGCGGFTNAPKVTFKWNANPELDLAGYWFGTKFNSKHEWIPAGTTTKTGNMTPGNNPYYYTIIAVDKAGNESLPSTQCGLILDTDAPTTTLTSPIDGDYSKTEFTITGSSSDINGVDFVSLYYQLDGEFDWTLIDVIDNPTSNSPFAFLHNWTPVANDTYNIKAVATDVAGNVEVGAHVYGLTYDVSQPELIILSPGADSAFNSQFIVNGTAIDAISGIDKVRVRFRNESNNALVATFWATYNSGDNTWSIDINDGINTLSEGYYLVRATAFDMSGNTRSRTVRRVHVDSTDPSSIITTFNLQNGEEVESNNFDGLIQGTATDDNSGVAEVNLEIVYTPFDSSEGLYWNGADWQTEETTVTATGQSTWSYQIDQNFIEDGTYDIVSHATDAAGNVESTYTIKIVYDKTTPTVALTIDPVSPDGSNGWYRFTQPSITLTANDNYNVDYIEYQWNSQVDGSWTTYSTSFKNPSEGQNILYYRSTDTAGNKSSVGIKDVKYDKTNPAGEPLDVRVENITNTNALGKWNAPTNDSDIDTYRLSWKHEDDSEYGATVSRNTFEHILNNLKDGLWTFTVRATDQAGNFTEKKVDFRVGSDPSSSSSNTQSSDGSVLGATDVNNDQRVLGATNTSDAQATDSEPSQAPEEETIQEEGSSEDVGLVMGATTCSAIIHYLPLLLLFLQTLSLIIFELLFRGSGFYKSITTVGIAIAFSSLLYAVGNPECYLADSWFALISGWFPWLALLSAGIVRFIGSNFIEEA